MRPGGATAAQPICNRQVGGFESPSGLQHFSAIRPNRSRRFCAQITIFVISHCRRVDGVL